MKIGMVAGEASGDMLGARLIHSLREQNPDLIFSGLGGPAMQAAGFHSQFDMNRLSMMGIIEPLFHLRDLFKLRRGLYDHFIQWQPDLVIGIDSPDFNLGLELKLKQKGIPTAHYVSPSVWAWRQNRIHKIKKAVDVMLTLFPFEKQFYEHHQMQAHFVGHPLADEIPLEIDQEAARVSLGIGMGQVIALLPGSRQQEIKYMGETFLEAAYLCYQANRELRFISSLIKIEQVDQLKRICQARFPDLPITFFIKRTREVLAAANAVLVCSGTATLETMLFKRPMVVAYKMANFNYQIGKRVVKIPYISLPNLLANKKLIPEYIQHEATPKALSESLLHYLTHPEEVKILQNTFLEMHRQLRCDASVRAAKVVLQSMS